MRRRASSCAWLPTRRRTPGRCCRATGPRSRTAWTGLGACTRLGSTSTSSACWASTRCLSRATWARSLLGCGCGCCPSPSVGTAPRASCTRRLARCRRPAGWRPSSTSYASCSPRSAFIDCARPAPSLLPSPLRAEEVHTPFRGRAPPPPLAPDEERRPPAVARPRVQGLQHLHRRRLRADGRDADRPPRRLPAGRPRLPRPPLPAPPLPRGPEARQ
mmetsp:Transcript_24990/g.83117  ORF Transcript_24990/g.83117 Transcript_24990/m.83117 type:complete len:217 (+) Transcript_24990:531-1181(+)